MTTLANTTGETWNYVRMSTKDGQEDSPLTQGQHTEEFLARENLPLWTRTYYDLGISGGSVDKRPGILAMLSDAERLRPACIVFYKLDRAFRNSYEQGLALRRLKKWGVQVYKVRDPNIDGPQGDMIDTILGAVNQFARELDGVRIRDHNQAMAQRGEWPGGPAPYGYQYRKAVKDPRNAKVILEPGRLESHPEEWPIARQIWDWALAGHRLAQILTLTREAGYRRRDDKPFVYTTLYRLFDSKVYSGYVPFGHYSGMSGGGTMRRPDKGEWYHGRHAPLVTDDEWHKVQLLLRQGNSKQRSRRTPRMELAGLIRCRHCGCPVASSGAIKTASQYVCIAAVRRQVEHTIWSRRDWVFHVALEELLRHIITLLPAEPPPTDSEAQREHLTADIARLHRELKRLRDLYRMGEYNDDMETYQADKLRVENKIAAKQGELRNAGASSDQLHALHHALLNWHDAYSATNDVATQQRLWRLFIDHGEADGDQLVVHLCDLGPGVPRVWQVELPPRGTRRPGTNNGGGKVTGQSKDGRQRGHLAKEIIRLQPLEQKV